MPSRVKLLFHSCTHARPKPSAPFGGVARASNSPVAGVEGDVAVISAGA